MPPSLTITHRPELKNATLLLALTGWMDGGLVSTGTVRRIMDSRDLLTIASIDSDPFYIYNLPGSMEIAQVFRPEVKYIDGIVTELDLPTNEFFCDVKANLVFFVGRKPHLRWQEFANSIFAVATAVGVKRIIFMGSFGGTVPHTREPRLFGSVSHPGLKPLLATHNVRLSDYEGPAGFSTLMLAQSPNHNIDMLSLVAEIPGYLQGPNPLSIEAVTRRLAHLLNEPVNFDIMRRASNEWETPVTKAVEKDEELAKTVRKLEEQYDNELIEHPDE